MGHLQHCRWPIFWRNTVTDEQKKLRALQDIAGELAQIADALKEQNRLINGVIGTNRRKFIRVFNIEEE